MIPEYKKAGVGKTLAGMLLGLLLAVLSPIVLMSEMLSLVPVIMLPAIALLALNRWAGRGPALFSSMMQLMFCARFMGNAFMWMFFFLNLMPVALLLRHENKPFFTQMKISIASFGTGVLLAVSTAYFSYGGNMVERVLMELPQVLRTLPVESMETVMSSYSMLLGDALSLDEFYLAFERMIASLVPAYQLNLPGLVFGGALVSAVLCVGLNGRIRVKQGIAAAESYFPMHEWALPGSTTGGLLLILAISFVMSIANFPQGEAVFYTVYDIAVAAFCIQALCSMARRIQGAPIKKGMRVGMLVMIGLLCIAGASVFVSIYGVFSATFGSKGMLRERMKNKLNNNHSDGNE